MHVVSGELMDHVKWGDYREFPHTLHHKTLSKLGKRGGPLKERIGS
jgi:hypothetical protein